MRTARACWLLALAGVGLFVASFALRPLDRAVGQAIVGQQGLVLVAGGLAFLGGVDFLLPAIAFTMIVLGAFGRWRGALRLGFVTATTDLATRFLKDVFERARPDYALVDAGGYSFPSGHASSGAALAVLLAWYATRHLKGRAIVTGALVAALAWAAAMALSRLVLGVHYLSDVVAGIGAGMAISAALLALSIVIEDRWPRRASSPGRSSHARAGRSTPAPPPQGPGAGPPPRR